MLVEHISDRSFGQVEMALTGQQPYYMHRNVRSSNHRDKEPTKATVFRMTISLWVPTIDNRGNFVIETATTIH